MPEVATSITINVRGDAAASSGATRSATIVTDPTTVGCDVPAMVRLAVAQRMTFTNTSDAAHTVTADNGAFDSGNIAQGTSWTFTAAKAGTFTYATYTCAYHPNMHGTIVVTG